jgi:hypothetical protein
LKDKRGNKKREKMRKEKIKLWQKKPETDLNKQIRDSPLSLSLSFSLCADYGVLTLMSLSLFLIKQCVKQDGNYSI